MRLLPLLLLFCLSLGAAEHPRLLFSKKDLPALRARLQQEPVKSMYESLKKNWNVNKMRGSIPVRYYKSFIAVNTAFLYSLSADKKWAEISKKHTEFIIKSSGEWAVDAFGLRLYIRGRCIALALCRWISCFYIVMVFLFWVGRPSPGAG